MKSLVLPALLATLCVSCTTLANRRDLYKPTPGSGPWTNVWVEKRTEDIAIERPERHKRISRHNVIGNTTYGEVSWWPLGRDAFLNSPRQPFKYEPIGSPEQ